MAGIVSKDISRRFLLPPEVVQAHDEGIIHFHDIDYFGMNAMSNCSLINLEDMLQNGTCINKVMIENHIDLLLLVQSPLRLFLVLRHFSMEGLQLLLHI